jgi:erythromycin esterase
LRPVRHRRSRRPADGSELEFWRTEELRDLLEWLRTWNVEHPDAPVRVGGTTPVGAPGLELALRLLEEAGIAAPVEWRRLLDEFPGRLRDLPWVEAALAASRATAVPPHGGDPRMRWIALLAETFPQALEVWSGRVPPAEQVALQDRYLAQNALAQLERFGTGGSAALLAHNLHVWHEPWRAGGLLRERLGPGYRAVFATFGRGQYNAHAGSRSGKWRPHPCPPPPPGSMEHVLDRLDLDCYAVEQPGSRRCGARWPSGTPVWSPSRAPTSSRRAACQRSGSTSSSTSARPTPPACSQSPESSTHGACATSTRPLRQPAIEGQLQAGSSVKAHGTR